MNPALDALDGALSALQEAGTEACADGDALAELYGLRARLDAYLAAAVASFDAAEGYAEDGARNAATWLACRLGIDKRAAQRDLRRGRACRTLAHVARAWSDGAITGDHVDVISRVRRPETEDALRRDEELLVGDAVRLRFDHFSRALRYWEQCADGSGAEENAAAQVQRRELHLDQSFDGLFLGRVVLDPVAGAIVSGELKRLEAELFDADWAAAREEFGEHARPVDLTRTPAQRRADALTEMARRSGAMAPGARLPKPLVTVLVGYETLRGRIVELANGTVVTPGALTPYLADAEFERAIYAPSGRIEVGTRARLFTGAIRRALELRDRECTHPFCDVDAENCEGDHVAPYALGGLTTQENGRILCGFHNRLREREPGVQRQSEGAREEPSAREGPSADVSPLPRERAPAG